MIEKKFQSHISGLTRALVEGALVRREIGISIDTSKYELVTRLPDDSFLHFPADIELAKTATALTAGATWIGVSGEGFANLSAGNLQNVIQQVDNLFTTVLGSGPTGSAGSLSEVSALSLLSIDQTFTNKTGQVITFEDSSGNDLIVLSDTTISIDAISNALNLGGTGINIISDTGVLIHAISGPIEMDGSVIIDSSTLDIPPLTLTPMTTPNGGVVDGSMWVETGGAYIRVNGATTRFDKASTLAEVSALSTTTLAQTFTAKPATDIRIVDANGYGLNFSPAQTYFDALSNITISSDDEIHFSAINQVLFSVPSSGTIEFSGNLYFANSVIHIVGNSVNDSSWRLVPVGNNLEYQRRETGVWVTKQVISA